MVKVNQKFQPCTIITPPIAPVKAMIEKYPRSLWNPLLSTSDILSKIKGCISLLHHVHMIPVFWKWLPRRLVWPQLKHFINFESFDMFRIYNYLLANGGSQSLLGLRAQEKTTWYSRISFSGHLRPALHSLNPLCSSGYAYGSARSDRPNLA